LTYDISVQIHAIHVTQSLITANWFVSGWQKNTKNLPTILRSCWGTLISLLYRLAVALVISTAKN